MLPLYVVEICQKTGTGTEKRKEIFSPEKATNKQDGNGRIQRND